VTYIDRTFRIAPRLFSQVLVLLAEEHGGVHFVIYGLLPNKTVMIHQRFLDMILGLHTNMNPDSISCDYETALFNTVSAGFPNAEIFGCFFFHFVKNFKKCIDSRHLAARYNTDADFALHARMILALAFVPCSRLKTQHFRSSLITALLSSNQCWTGWKTIIAEDVGRAKLALPNQRCRLVPFRTIWQPGFNLPRQQWSHFRTFGTAVAASRNGTRQPLICVLVVKSKQCPTLSTLVLCQS